MIARVMNVLIMFLILGGIALAVILFSIYLNSGQNPEVILSTWASVLGIIAAVPTLQYIILGEWHPKYLFEKKDKQKSN